MMKSGKGAAGEQSVFGEGVSAGVASKAYRLDLSDGLSSPVLIAVPHAGRDYPPDLLASMRNPDFSTLRLEDRLVDLLARDVARQTGASLLIASAPRAMIDLNRAIEDMDWSMVIEGGSDTAVRPAPHSAANRRARGGLGLIPRRLNGMGEIWRDCISYSELQRRIAEVHEPYHIALQSTLDRIRRRWGSTLLIDLHSMPPLRPRRPADRPAHYVLGDRFGASCNGMLSATAMRYFGQVNVRAAHNRPYAGGYVLDRHGAPSLGIHAMQIEVCRSLYLENDYLAPSEQAGEIAGLLAGLVRTLAEEVLPNRDWQQAAE